MKITKGINIITLIFKKTIETHLYKLIQKGKNKPLEFSQSIWFITFVRHMTPLLILGKPILTILIIHNL